jgi:putative colanic acid biosynthesis acetyltransferase WcaF
LSKMTRPETERPVFLRRFDNDWYRPGRSKLIQALWYFVGLPVCRSPLNPFSSLKRFLLGAFGATIGHRVIIKPGVRIKYPWLFHCGDDCWLGEDCWIDNLAQVSIGANVCISQGAYLCTGNHDWSDPAFGLIVRPISIGDGAWVGAKALIAPGVSLSEGAVAAAGSVVTHDIPAYEIHAGNPAAFVRRRPLRRSGSGKLS